MNQEQQDEELKCASPNMTPDMKDDLQKRCELLLNCMSLNNIKAADGTSACITIALCALSHAGASNKTINQIVALVLQAQDEVISKQMGTVQQ